MSISPFSSAVERQPFKLVAVGSIPTVGGFFVCEYYTLQTFLIQPRIGGRTKSAAFSVFNISAVREANINFVEN
jgi:hypothetical protein